jgi:hypothetical protein
MAHEGPQVGRVSDGFQPRGKDIAMEQQCFLLDLMRFKIGFMACWSRWGGSRGWYMDTLPTAEAARPPPLPGGGLLVILHHMIYN